MSIEGKTNFEKVIGGTQKDREEVFMGLQDMFESKSGKLAEYELEKTAEDIEIINETQLVADEIIKDYGGKPKIVPLDNIYVLKPGSVREITDGKLSTGIHRPLSQKIGVEKSDSRIMFASGMAHELFHAESHKAARVGKSVEDLRLYRNGISMIDRKDKSKEAGEEREYFNTLEEAIVAECTKKFLERIEDKPLFRDEAGALDTIRAWVVDYYRKAGLSEEQLRLMADELKYVSGAEKFVKTVKSEYEDENSRSEFAAGMLHAYWDRGKAEPLERWKERERMYKLFDEIVQKSEGAFNDREEVFKIFARAHFTGDYLEIARIVEKIRGEGAFRELAEEFSKTP